MIAENYQAYAHIQRDLLEWGWPQLDPWLGECQKVLEVGAGTGMMTRHWVGVADEVTASDYSGQMCAHGEKNVPEAFWQCLNAWHLNVEGAYDCIASSSFLHWAESPVSVLGQWKQALRSKGLIIALLFNEGTAREYYSLGQKSPVSWRDQNDWRRFFVEAGFEPLLMKEKPCSYVFPSAYALLRFLRETGTPGMSTKMGVGDLMKICKAYTENYAAVNGGVYSTWSFGLIVARRA